MKSSFVKSEGPPAVCRCFLLVPLEQVSIEALIRRKQADEEKIGSMVESHL